MQASSRGLVDVSWFTRLAQRSPCKYAGKNKLTFCNLSKIRRYDVAWLFGDATVKRQLLRDFGLSAPYSQMSNLSHLSPTRIFPLILSENFTILINSTCVNEHMCVSPRPRANTGSMQATFSARVTTRRSIDQTLFNSIQKDSMTIGPPRKYMSA